jgi:phosphoadenosine phosphosulfate reductase
MFSRGQSGEGRSEARSRAPVPAPISSIPNDALTRLSIAAAGDDPGDRLSALREAVPGRILFTTSFGVEDQAIAHFIFERKLAIEVATLDTGRLFPSTYKVWEETELRYGARIRSFHPDRDALAAFVADAGINGFLHSKEARLGCCGVRKVEPLRRALAGAEAWVTGLRADQSPERGKVALAAWDEERRLIKLAPLFDWSRARAADFCAAEGVPVNALHAEGFLSIGCQPCTRAVAPGEPERAGRWWWENDEVRECGLHVGADGKPVRSKAA